MSRYDVAVVGLGAMGSAALCHLAERGQRVIGIERFEPGHEHGSSHGESRAIRLGYFEHPSYVPLVRRAYEAWRDLEARTGETVLTITGVLEMGRPGSVIVEGSLRASREHGIPHEELDAHAIMRRFPQFTLPGDYIGVWQGDGGFVRPELANRLHLQLAQAAGAQARFGARVVGLDAGSRSIALTLADGERIEADRVALCAGAWIGDLVPELAPSLHLTRQVLVWFAARDPDAVKLGALPVFVIDGPDDIAYGFPQISADGFKCASHLSSGDLADADAASQDAGPADADQMRRVLERYLPAAVGPVTRMRTCLYTKTPDEDFVIDRLPSDLRIVVASPCSGHGFKFASVIGEILADLAICGTTRHDISRFAMDRFATRA